MRMTNYIKLAAGLVIGLALIGCSKAKSLDDLLAEPALRPMKWVKQNYNTERKFGAQMDGFDGGTQMSDPIAARKNGTYTAAKKAKPKLPFSSSTAEARRQGMRIIEAYAVTFGLLGLEKSPDEGAQLFKAYLKDHPNSHAVKNEMGVLYYTGTGIAKDDAMAVKMWRQAVLHTSAARFNLAIMYHYGHGVKADPVEAYMWMELAASCTNNTALGVEAAVDALPLLAAQLNPDRIEQANRRTDRWMKKNDVAFDNYFCKPGRMGHHHYNPRHNQSQEAPA